MLSLDFVWRSSSLLILLLAISISPLQAQSKIEGLWSDPPATPLGSFCSGWCTDAGIERLNRLLDDPANDARPFSELQTEADAFQRQQYLRARLTDRTLKTFPLDPADDPGLLRCEPWGLARQMFARHQIEIRASGKDQIELRYGEWDARRTVYMDGRARPATAPTSGLGFSIGRWEGDTLVVETTGITANITSWRSTHSAQLRIAERFTRSPDGQTLQLTATMEDPESLSEPVVVKKLWRWAPESKIAPYTDCEPAAGVKREVRP